MNHNGISNTALFKGIEKKLLNQLIDGGSFQTFTKKEMAYTEGERASKFGIVVSGFFRLTKDDLRGERVSILFLSSGDLTGDLVMAEPNSLYTMTCEALHNGHIFWIPRETYLRSWLTTPVITQRVQVATLARINWMIQSRADQRLNLDCRLAGLLLRASAYVSANAEGVELTLTRRDLADAVGASVESVIRVMTKWEARGLVSTASQVIRILQPSFLKSIYTGIQSGDLDDCEA